MAPPVVRRVRECPLLDLTHPLSQQPRPRSARRRLFPQRRRPRRPRGPQRIASPQTKLAPRGTRLAMKRLGFFLIAGSLVPMVRCFSLFRSGSVFHS